MLIQGSLAGVNGAVATATFLRFLAERVPAGHYFLVEPPPGIAMTSAIDWRVVLSDAAHLAPLAAALWRGYETLVLPLHKGAAPGAGIVVQVRNSRGQFDQFVLGREITEEAAFVHRLQESVRLLYPGKTAGDVQQELARTLDSGYWVNIAEL
ncbi:MAG TPA: hypothetical protein VIU40_04380 [Geobacteraceae bacterium]